MFSKHCCTKHLLMIKKRRNSAVEKAGRHHLILDITASISNGTKLPSQPPWEDPDPGVHCPFCTGRSMKTQVKPDHSHCPSHLQAGQRDRKSLLLSAAEMLRIINWIVPD